MDYVILVATALNVVISILNLALFSWRIRDGKVVV